MSYAQKKSGLAAKSMAVSPMTGSTAMTKNTDVQAKTTSKNTSAMPARPISSGSNAQTEQMARTINKTNKVQGTYGMPGVK